jgi:hypothetical protein
MRRGGLTISLLIVAFASGCGGSGGDRTTACSRVSTSINTFGSDVRTLSTAPEESSAQNQIVADTDTFKAALSELRSNVSSQADQSTIDQYKGVLGRFEQAIEAAASESYATGNGDLAGIADEIGGLNAQIHAMCK